MHRCYWNGENLVIDLFFVLFIIWNSWPKRVNTWVTLFIFTGQHVFPIIERSRTGLIRCVRGSGDQAASSLLCINPQILVHNLKTLGNPRRTLFHRYIHSKYIYKSPVRLGMIVHIDCFTIFKLVPFLRLYILSVLRIPFICGSLWPPSCVDAANLCLRNFTNCKFSLANWTVCKFSTHSVHGKIAGLKI